MNKKVDMFNPYDLSNKYTKMLKKFIIDHPIDDINKIIDIKINKMNIILIREINEYNEKFAYINRIIRIINQYYRDFYKISENNSKLLYTGPLRNLLNIWNSIKEQKRLFNVIKVILKKVPVTNEMYNALKYNINKTSKRLDDLLINILPEYINITPLYDYSKILESEGLTLYDDIIALFPYNDILEKEDPLIQKYIDNINRKIGDNKEYLENLYRYQKICEKRSLEYQKIKENEKIQRKIRKSEETQKVLYNKSHIIYHNYELSFQACSNSISIDNKNHIGFIRLKMNIMEFKYNNKCDEVKILLLAKTHSGVRASAKYYSENKENLMSDSPMNATIFKVDDPIPTHIQEMVDKYDLVYCELVL